MAIKTSVVIHNAATKKHEPLAVGDKLAGSVIQLSTDAGQSITTGTDGGLLVTTVAGLPDDQVLTGDNSGSVSLTLTPATQPNGDVNYTIKGEVKIDPAAGNAAVATAAGVYVPTPTVPTYTGKQIEFGSQAATTAIFQTYNITFATAFPSVPFVTLSSSIQKDLLLWKARNVTTTGFLLEGYGNRLNQSTGDVPTVGFLVVEDGSVFNQFTGNVNWKAEEK